MVVVISWGEFRHLNPRFLFQLCRRQAPVTEFARRFPAEENRILPQVLEDLLGVQAVQNLLVRLSLGGLVHRQHLLPGSQGFVTPAAPASGKPQGN